MDSPLRKALLELERRLRAQDAPAGALLARGRARDEVSEMLLETLGSAPNDVVTWFSWCDGVTSPPTSYNPLHRVLIGRWRPYSLSESLDYLQGGRQWAGHPRDDRSWLPLVDGMEGTGQGMSMLMAAWRQPQHVAVVKSGWGDPYVEPVADTLDGLVTGWLTVLDDGLRWDTDADTWITPELTVERSRYWQRVL